MSNRVDLKLLAERENGQVEWKENVADEFDVVETIAAFANDLSNLGGGYVVCGAKEGRDAAGFPEVQLAGLESSRLKEVEGKVLALCRSHVDPDLAPLVEVIDIPGQARKVLVFIVAATRKAHQVRRRSGEVVHPVRVSHNTIEARNGLLRELLVRKGDVEPWDRRPCAKATVNDLDLLALRDALQRMGVYRAEQGVEHYLSDTNQLHAMVPPLCIKDPLTGTLRPRNVTVLLFGTEVQRFVPGAITLFSLYPGTDRSTPQAERHEIAGTLISQTRRALELLQSQASTVFDKTDPVAPNAVKYPSRALQEAAVNALVHRDYESVDPARITVFSDRVEILSPGPLPTGLDPADFLAGRATPKWRNQALAWFMNRLQFAQAEGQGIPTIFGTMREEGCPPPRFEVNSDRVVCVLPAHPRLTSRGNMMRSRD